MGGGACVNELKKTGARSARARTRGQNRLVVPYLVPIKAILGEIFERSLKMFRCARQTSIMGKLTVKFLEIVTSIDKVFVPIHSKHS
jgi:hypothetical protein